MPDTPIPSTEAVPELSAWDKKRAQEQRRQDRRARNDQLFTAVMQALDPKRTLAPLAERLAAVRAAIANGGDVNAKATLVDHLKERPLGMVAHHIASDAAGPVMQLLMEHGADPSVLDKHGNTFTHTLVAKSWRHRYNAPPALQNNLQAWLKQVGPNHLATANLAGETPLSLALIAIDQHAPRDPDGIPGAPLVHALVAAGARHQDLPPHTLFTLLEKNHRAGFDLAVALGVDPQQRRGTTNLWKAWADHQDTPYASMNAEADRRAWMERLIELKVDPVNTCGPSPFTGADAGDASALMLLLAAALRQVTVDEVCLTRLKNLGCPVQAQGRYPLHDLAGAAKVAHLATLHRLGFDLAGARNHRNETLVHAVCQADLRNVLHYQGETRTAEATVAVLLDAGCPPGGLPTVQDKEPVHSPLAMAVRNGRHEGRASSRFDRLAVVEQLIAAGASINESEPARHLIGHLFYGQVFSATEVSLSNHASFVWQTLFLRPSEEDLVFLLRKHGAQLPDEVVPNGMPFLLGLVPSRFHNVQEDQQRRDLWNRLVETESPGWAERFALKTLQWIGQGERHTNLKHDRCVELVEWCVTQGIDENTWGAAARAANYQPSHPMTQYIEQMELRATIRALPEAPGTDVNARSRPRL